MTPPTNPPAPIDGAALLDQVEHFHRRFNVFPTESAYVAVTLWDAHAHLIDCFDFTPRLAFLSPEPGSGKSRALEIVETLAPNPLMSISATVGAMFRAVSEGQGADLPTVLFDEVDTIFGPKAGDNEPLRGFINAGHKRGFPILRCVGEGSNQEHRKFETFCPVAMGGLGSLPETILSRSVIIRMRKKAPNEKVEPFRLRVHPRQGHALRDQLATWAGTVRERVADAWPEMPEGVDDRPADVWEPLIAVADAAGGHWPERARAACVDLLNALKEEDKTTIGVRLLTDLRDEVFRGDAEHLPTSQIISVLNALDESPWGDLDGKPLDPRTLSRMLSEYVTTANKPIKPRSIKTSTGRVLRGYHVSDLKDAWKRYCPPPAGTAATAATGATEQAVSSTDEVADTTNNIRYLPATAPLEPATAHPGQ